jgi:hypothetical protein
MTATVTLDSRHAMNALTTHFDAQLVPSGDGQDLRPGAGLGASGVRPVDTEGQALRAGGLGGESRRPKAALRLRRSAGVGMDLGGDSTQPAGPGADNQVDSSPIEGEIRR